MVNRSTLNISFLFFILMASTYGLCPEKCLCKWKGGKETVECRNASLTQIPPLDATTQVLDLSYNNLVRISQDSFRSLNLLNLQKIYLRHCNLHAITGRCFMGMHNLIELDLSKNLLQKVPTEALTDGKYLMILSLAGNPIRQVTKKQFAGLKHLETLDLSFCQIMHIEPATFQAMGKLHWLQLENNLIETLAPDLDIPASIKGVSLNQNRWRCDCNLINMRDFLRNRTLSYQIEPMCFSPDWISGQRITDLADSELACLPKVSPSSSFEEVISGKNMSLICTVESIPLSGITWRYKGLLLNNGSTMVTDVDRRTYIYSIQADQKMGTIISTLVIHRTTLSDSGLFQCEAENRAGVVVGNFTVSVVKPVPPESPKERKVEERFNNEYIVVIGVTSLVISVLTIAISMVFFLICRGVKRRRAAAANSRRSDSGPNLYQTSVSEGSFTSDKTIITLHSSKTNCFVDNISASSVELLKKEKSCVMSEHHQMPPELTAASSLAAAKLAASGGENKLVKKTYSVMLTNSTSSDCDLPDSTNHFNHVIVTDPCDVLQPDNKPLFSGRDETFIAASSSFTGGEARSSPRSSSVGSLGKGVKKPEFLCIDAVTLEAGQQPATHSMINNTNSLQHKRDPKEFEDRRMKSHLNNHWHFSTLPKNHISKEKMIRKRGDGAPDNKTCEELILPPPPQFKGVHFDATIEEEDCSLVVPKEGLPILPAGQSHKSAAGHAGNSHKIKPFLHGSNTKSCK